MLPSHRTNARSTNTTLKLFGRRNQREREGKGETPTTEGEAADPNKKMVEGGRCLLRAWEMAPHSEPNK